MMNQGLPLHVNPTMRFVYSSYWGTYSRVLQYPTWSREDQKSYQMIEVNVTPINGVSCTLDELDRVRRINIRRHLTQIDAKDEFTNVIPLWWYDQLGSMIGPKRRDFIMFGNISVMDHIDWVKYNKVNNGGASLFDILKDGVEINA